jgi:hypothetical protein
LLGLGWGGIRRGALSDDVVDGDDVALVGGVDADQGERRRLLVGTEGGRVEQRRGLRSADEGGDDLDLDPVDQACTEQGAVEAATTGRHDRLGPQPLGEAVDGGAELDRGRSDDQVGDGLRTQVGQVLHRRLLADEHQEVPARPLGPGELLELPADPAPTVDHGEPPSVRCPDHLLGQEVRPEVVVGGGRGRERIGRGIVGDDGAAAFEQDLGPVVGHHPRVALRRARDRLPPLVAREQ